jgi:acetyltransferase-like isoleucine patch superfamily enzyme
VTARRPPVVSHKSLTSARVLRYAVRAIDQARSQIRRRGLLARYPGLKIDRSTYIGRRCRVTCSDHSRLELVSAHIADGSVIQADEGGQLTITRSSVGTNSVIVAADKIAIGPDCAIAEMVVIRDQDHAGAPGSRWQVGEFRTGPIIVGQRTWIGAKATLLKGVAVGEDAVIAAGAVVTKDVPAKSVVAGVPAAEIGARLEGSSAS